ncbi:MAG: arabinogalactan endo-1,4-beta-galactosidase [Kiritimatiellaceae bacterium]|nr:arabinogalactan endo-1,4-beta-galactosidase [Kiritimatiellaceae bacterium]
MKQSLHRSKYFLTTAVICTIITTGSLHAMERRLPYVGITPYSDMKTSFYDKSGKEYPNVLALAHQAGANTARVFYYAGDNNEVFYERMKVLRELGMRSVCTIFPSRRRHDKNFQSVLARTTRECRDAVKEMKARGVAMPDLFTIGNEINAASLNPWASLSPKEGDFMDNTAQTLCAAAKGLRAGGFSGDIGVHIDRSWKGFYEGIIEHGFTDWQVIAQSFYPKKRPGSNDNMAQQMEYLNAIAKRVDKKILIIETGAPYVLQGTPESRAKHDHTGAQDFHPDMVEEVSPRGQAMHVKHMCELILNLPDERGLGVLTWGSDLTKGIHRWDHVTWNRAQVTPERVALPSLYIFGKYAESTKSNVRKNNI